MLVERTVSLAETLDRILDKGIVIDARLRVALVGIDLLDVDACLIVASIETYVAYATRPGGLMGRAPARRGPRPDAARRARVPDTTAARTIEAALNAWNAHDPQAYEALLDDDYFGETHGAPAPLRGRSGALWAMQMKLRLFPDLQFKIQDTMTSGNDVIVSWVATATRGNERVRVPGCTVGALRRGRVTHTWCYWDTDDMLAPLRVISGRPSDGPPTVHRLPTTP